MRTRTAERVVTVVLLVGVVVLMTLAIKTPVNIYDEGNILTAAHRLLSGEIPYRDFWGVYPPGQLVAVAGVLAVFGDNLAAPRIYDIVVRLALVFLAYGFARRLAGPRTALLVAGIFGVALAAVGRHYVYPVQPALLFALAALVAWHGALRVEVGPAGSRARALGAGLLLGVATLFRWDIGAYAAVSLVVVSLLVGFGGDAERRPVARRSLLLGIVGSVLVAGAGYGVVAVLAGPATLWDQVVWFPATGLHDARSVPYPAPWALDPSPGGDWMQFYLPLGLLAIVLVTYLVALLRTRNRLTPVQYGALASGLFGLVLFSQALSRFDRSHVLPATLLAAFSFAVLVQQSPSLRHPKAVRVALAVILAGSTLVFGYVGLRVVAKDALRYSPVGCYSNAPTADCASLTPDQQGAIGYIQSVTTPDQPIFVANAQNERINVNDTSFYFLADRPAASRYAELHPGVADTAAVQSEIVGQLQASPVRYVVLVTLPESTEPNLSSRGFGVTVLDDYLRQAYAPATSFGTYAVLERR